MRSAHPVPVPPPSSLRGLLMMPCVLMLGAVGLTHAAAVSALVKVNDGATGLLSLAKTDRLPDDLKFLAGSELRTARWPAVRGEADKLFPAPTAKGNQALPPLAELVKLPGDATRGAAVFRRADVGCINCHQVNGEGVDFGPKLSEIGAKLGKDALGEAVLDPSAGISFGYEAWSLTLKNGDEAFGLIASETEDEIARGASHMAIDASLTTGDCVGFYLLLRLVDGDVEEYVLPL